MRVQDPHQFICCSYTFGAFRRIDSSRVTNNRFLKYFNDYSIHHNKMVLCHFTLYTKLPLVRIAHVRKPVFI